MLLHRANFILKKYVNTKRIHLQWVTGLLFIWMQIPASTFNFFEVDKLLTIRILFFKIKMKTMLHGCLELVLIINTAPGWRYGRWYYTNESKLLLQIATLTFCNLHCFKGEKRWGIVINISHLYLDHTCTRKPGHPFICGLYNQAGLEKNQEKQYKYQISSWKFKN